MHFRVPSRAAAFGARGALRTFTTSPRLTSFHHPADSHYDVLKLPHDASESEIKKSFYSLSKLHHPDRNPSDPHAPKRFIRISEAYSVLSAPAKRAAYDRDLRNSHAQPHRGPHYHTPTGPAGGRPPSGLSRRRTTTSRGTFRGPPNSFYAGGGYGAHADKRREAHEQSTGMGGAGATGSAGHAGGTSGMGTAGGMGYGQDPFHRPHAPHFDKAAHEKTHRAQDQRRARRAGEEPPQGEQGASFGFALVVFAILGSTGFIPWVLLGGLNEPKPRKAKSGPSVARG